MSDDTSFLPYFIQEEIYLIQTPEEEKAVINKGALPDNSLGEISEPEHAYNDGELHYEGKNLKRVLILTENSKADYLTKEEKIFLGKILHAINLNFEDIALINTHSLPDNVLQKINHFDCQYIISFGVTSEQLILNGSTPLYQIKKQNNISLLLSDPLYLIEKDQTRKRKLWNCLKQLF